MIWKLALLGSIKHWRRSLVVIGAVSVACAVRVAIGSLLNGITGSFYDSVVPNAGHVRIDDAAAPKALNPFGLALLIPDADRMIAKIQSLGDGRIVAVEPVLSFGALLVEDSPEGDPRNLPLRGLGLNPDTRFADNARDALVEGSFLPEGRGILISEASARLVGAGLGKKLLVLVQDRNGQPWYESLPVTGIFRTESRDFDATTFYLSWKKAGEMLDAPGAAREIRLLLANRDDAVQVSAELERSLTAGPVSATATAPSATARSLRILPWQTINASVFAILLFVKILLGTIMGLFAIVAGTIIANTVLMSITERIREFGTMRAIGLRARALEGLILAEGLILGAAGALLGLGLGAIVIGLLSTGGLDLGGLMENMGLRRYNRPRPDLAWFIFCSAASLLVSLAATTQAARSLAKKSVAESLTAAQA